MNEPQYEVTPNGAIAYKPVPALTAGAEATLAAETITHLFGVGHVNDIDFTIQHAIDAATEKLRAELAEWKQAADVEAKCHDETLAKNTLLHESHDALAKEVEELRADKARLDWLEHNLYSCTLTFQRYLASGSRQALDAAMTAQKGRAL